jgi:hypothetical protein
MAVLSTDTLSGCSSIPSFLGGSADTPANPTVSVFRNTNAPTNWVKKTTHNDKSLRIIGGANGTALSPGGTSAFTTILAASRPFPGTISPSSTGIGNAGPNPSSFSSTSEQMVYSASPYSPSTPQMAAHSHPTVFYQPTLNSAGPLAYGTVAAASVTSNTNPETPSGGTTHSHPISVPHSHGITDGGHTHTLSSDSPHNHPFSGTAQNFAVTYVDIIIATKS